MQKTIQINSQLTSMPSICVIISAFNAERYIQEQLDSILRQENVDVNIWIRDDGSTDGTLALLTKKYGENSKIVVKTGKNLGAANSFLEAIFSCEFECDYYAFSDADDVWLDDKTECSIEILRRNPINLPAAVVGRLQIVDESLNLIGYTAIPRKGLSFRNALVQTVASGAATTLNKVAFKLLRSARPNFVVMHDSWTYLVITAFGKFYYSETPHLLYRQHGSNVFGANYSWKKRVLNRLRRLMPAINLYERQANEFSRLYGDRLDAEKKVDLLRYLNYRESFVNRLKFAFFPSIVRQRIASNVYMRFLILFGKE